MTRDRLSAVGLPDSTIEVWAAETTATEAGPRAGIPTPTADTTLLLTASGQQTAAIEIQTARGGLPRRDGEGATSTVTQSAGVLWRPSGGSWRGWDPPRTLSRYESVYVDLSTGSSVRDPDVIITEAGVAVAVCEESETAGGPWNVLVLRRQPGSATWARVEVESFTSDPGYAFRPTLVTLPTGRIHLYRYLDRGDYSGLRWWYSDDDGATWAFGGDGGTDITLRDDGGDGPTRMRARYSRGQILLIARMADVGGRITLRQLCSSDLGHHFQHVADADSTSASFASSPGVSFDVAPSWTGGFVVGVTNLVIANQAHTIRIPSGTRPLSDGEAVRQPTPLDANAVRIAVAADESGTLLCVTGTADAAHKASASMDGGTTWGSYWTDATDVSRGACWGPLGIDIQFDLALAVGRGRGLLLHRWAPATYTLGAALAAVYLGGWATPTQPLARQTDSEYDSVGWRLSVLPYDPPDDYTGIAPVGSVTATVQEATGATAILATSGQNAAYTYQMTALDGVSENPVAAVRLVAQCVTGGSLSALRAGVQIKTSATDGGDDCVIELRMTPGTWRLWDAVAGAQIGADVTHATGSDVEILIAVEHTPSPVVRTYWRLRTDDEDRVYAAGPTGAFADAAFASPQSVQFGVFSGSADATTFRLVEVSIAPGITVNNGRYPASVTTADLAARTVAGRPYLGSGAYIVARQGPTWRGETWTLAPEPDFGLARAVDEPSPRAVWRSTSTGQQRIALRWDAQRSPVLALAVRGSNVPQMEIETWNGSGWDALGTATLSSRLPYTRSGQLVTPTGSTSGYLSHGEAVGSYLSLGAAVTGRRIAHQTEGQWSATGRPRARITLEAVGADPTAGTGQLVWSDALIVLDLSGVDTTAIRLTIPAASSSLLPPEDYWQIGTLAARWLWPLGEEYAWGDAIEEVAHVEGARTRDQLWRGVQVAPASRRVSLQFSTVNEQGLSARPSVVQIGGAEVSRQATARALAGYLRELGGSVGSLLYVPDVPAGSLASALPVLLGRQSFVLGRLAAGDLRRSTLQGSPRGEQAVDAGEIVIEEDP